MGEGVPGGFAAVYGVLKVMEESGKVRRGYFVSGLGGSQFAQPGALDRLPIPLIARDQASTPAYFSSVFQGCPP